MTFGLESGKGRYEEFKDKWVYINMGSLRPTGVLREIDLKQSSLVLSPFVVQDYHGNDLPMYTRIDEGRTTIPLGDWIISPVSEEVIMRSVRDCQIEFAARYKKREHDIKGLEKILNKYWWQFWK